MLNRSTNVLTMNDDYLGHLTPPPKKKDILTQQLGTEITLG